MQPLPDCIVSKMDQAAPLVLNALSQLEHFLAAFNLSLHPSTDKHDYVHDFSLMLACDDLDAIASQLLDHSGKALTEHRIQIGSDLDRFKRHADRPSRLTVDIPVNLVADHASPLVYRRGKTGYQDWLCIDWGTDARRTPAHVTHAIVTDSGPTPLSTNSIAPSPKRRTF